MIFKRKKSSVSSASIDNHVDEKIAPKAETLYVGAMCFVAACLSFITLEVGARSPLGQSVAKSATFNAIFRRNYNMKIRIMITNVVMALITTIMLGLGDVYRIPYLHVPWLCNTMRGMIFYEGPALLGLTNIWLPDAGIPAGAFIFITLLLFVEELCLWFDVFNSLKNCWIEYNEYREQAAKSALPAASNERDCDTDEQKNNLEQAVAKSRLTNVDINCHTVAKPANIVVHANSTYSNANTKLRATKSSNDSRRGNS